MKEKLIKAYKPPFEVDEEGANVMDSEQNFVIAVRGWSRLSKLFEHDEAFKLQLDIAHFISGKLNEFVEEIEEEKERDEDWGRTEDDKLENNDITF